MNQKQDSWLDNQLIESVHQKIRDKLQDFFSSSERVRLLVVVGLIGIIMIFCSELSVTSKKPKEMDVPNFQQEELSGEVYIQNIENRLQEIISQIDGVGECSVMVTLEESNRKIFACEDKTSQEQGDNRYDISSEKRLVLLETQNGVAYPIVETMRSPKIKGVMVVCKGAKSAKVCQQVTEAVTTVLGIRSNQICVSPKSRS